MFKNIKISVLLLLISYNPIFSKTNLANVEIRYDWDKIEPIKLEDLKFPKDFIWGVATSAHQVDGNCNCQWTDLKIEKIGVANNA